MAQILKLRRSAIPGAKPTTSQLDFGELALNTSDGKIFMRKSSSLGDEVIEIGGTSLTSSYSLYSVSSSYSLTASYVNSLHQDVIITGSLFVTQSHISTVDYIDFTVNPGIPAHLEGRVHWDVDRKTLELDTDVNNFMISVGHVNVIRGKNQTGNILSKGTVVYINGNSGQFATFNTASWDSEANSAYTIGIIAQDINNSNSGYAVIQGEITGINTNGYAPSTLLYLSSSGQYTSTKPIAPLQAVRLGQVVVASTNGSIQVKIDNGYETDELHDVLLINDTSGDLFVRSGSLWINSKQLTGSYGLTGSLSADNITVKGTLTAQTLIVQTITSSINYITGSTIFGSSLSNTHQFTGSVLITGSLTSPSITGSLFGTASWAQNALTASYISATNVAGLSLFQITTGSVTASVGVGLNDLFLIKSGSTTYFNISSSGDTTLATNKLTVKNLTTNQPILTISQSIIQFATQSVIPTGTTSAGSIVFTSSSMYIGLE